MARRVFMHVGTPKSGTSYLQRLWWRHHDALRSRGLLLPGTEFLDHFRASCLVTDRSDVLERLSVEERATWDRLLEETASWDADALISHELFSRATPAQADTALRQLEGAAAEVHVVVTGRDLARQLPSGWQQNVKQGRTFTLREFWERARDGASDFWRFQDIPALVDRWGQGIPGTRRHLVVLPPPGGPRDLLWQHACDLLGVDPAGLTTQMKRANESLGPAEVEMMRRMHQALPPDRRGLDTRRLAMGFFTDQVLVPAGRGGGFVLPADIHAWAVTRSSAMVEQLRGRDLQVLGDLADLVPGPQPPGGRTPEDVTETEVSEVAVDSLARFLLYELDRREGLRPGGSSGRPRRRGRRLRPR